MSASAVLTFLSEHAGPLVVLVLAVAEVAYLVETRLGASAAVRFLGAIASAAFVPEPVANSDWLRIAELVWRYRDLPLGTVDASLVALAERLGVTSVATLDRRHFAVVRPAHALAFELLP
ncbi:MAG: PIN domain-containing protein [Chloroflexota bacterium]|nr:PIN domain-containing protein [Chloroflexota bacterium]